MNKLQEIKKESEPFLVFIAAGVILILGFITEKEIMFIFGFGIIVIDYLGRILNVLILSMEYFIEERDKNVR